MNTWNPSANELFLKALEYRSEAERQEYLCGVCGQDVAMRAEVDSLLDASSRIGGFLESAAESLQLRATPEDHVTERGGTVIGPYRLLEQIGEGGFGVVFVAEQSQPIRRKVALKIVKAGMDTSQVIARFEAERQALAIMDHPNIAKVLDGGATVAGRPYFVMELVKGTPVTEFCDQNHLTPHQRLELFVSVCQAVQHAHLKGIIHRDLKPSNILVSLHDTKPVIKVIDFGIAKALGQDLTERTLFTGIAQMVGTPLYMSPEQAGMSDLDVDTRSDIYSLGVLLYELLTGTTPFLKEHFKTSAIDEIRRIISDEDPPKPSTRLAESPETLLEVSSQRRMEPAQLTKLVCGELDWIVMKALEKDRNRRYETANSFAMDVQRYLADEPVQACPPRAAYRVRKFVRRHRAALTAATLTTTALLVGTAISVWQAIRATQAEALATERLEAEGLARREAVHEKNQSNRRLFEARLAEARACRSSPRVGQRHACWQALIEATRLAREYHFGEVQLAELRNEAIACLAMVDVRPVQEWQQWPPGPTSGLACDANLEHFARCDLNGTVTVFDVAQDREVARLPGPKGDVDLSFSPDGVFLAVQYKSSLPLGKATNCLVWDWRRGVTVFEPSFRVDDLAVGFSPDSQHVAFGQHDGTLTIHHLPDGKETHRLSGGVVPQHLCFHPKAHQLAVASWHQQEVQLWDLDTLTKTSWPMPSNVNRLGWHPDGVLLAVACHDGNIYLWDTQLSRCGTVLRGHQTQVMGVDFSPDGNWLLSYAWDGTSRIWDPWAGHELLRMPGVAQQWSRDGTRIARRAGSHLGIWELATNQEYRSLPRKHAGLEGTWSGDISRDGRWLVMGTRQGIRLWDLALCQESAFIPCGKTIEAKFHPVLDELFTSGHAGLCRWPLVTHQGVQRIGPPSKLPARGILERIGWDQTGSILVVASYDAESRILDLTNLNGTNRSFQHPSATHVAVSPNGKWIASAGHERSAIQLWELATGNHLRDLIPDTPAAKVAFSPDSKWLLTATNREFGIWAVESWQLVRQIPRDELGDLSGTMTFSRDGKVLALTPSPSEVRLLDPATGRILARLQTPDSEEPELLLFSPDGGKLLTSTGLGTIRVWDLRRIRDRLREIGLDWDQPAFAPPAAARELKPMKIDYDLGELPPGTP